MKDSDIESCLMGDFPGSVQRNEGVCMEAGPGVCMEQLSGSFPPPHPQESTWIKGCAHEALVTYEAQEEENKPKESA